jgi:hypothetical protein
MRSVLLAAVVVLVGCSGSDSHDASCSGSCTASIHYGGKTGIPVGVDPVTVEICRGADCLGLDVAVPATTTTQSTGTDPRLDANVQRTTDPYATDLQGVFQLDVTWTSTSQHIRAGDFVVLHVTAPSGGNVLTSGKTVPASDVNASCGCPSVDLPN